MKPYAEKFYKSAAWVKCRNAYMKSVHYLCEDCMSKGIYKPAEEVHHIVFITPQNIHDPTVTLNEDNMVALCRECHRRRHNLKEGKRYSVNSEGFVIPIGDGEEGAL